MEGPVTDQDSKNPKNALQADTLRLRTSLEDMTGVPDDLPGRTSANSHLLGLPTPPGRAGGPPCPDQTRAFPSSLVSAGCGFGSRPEGPIREGHQLARPRSVIAAGRT